MIIVMGIAIGSVAMMNSNAIADYQNIGIAPTDAVQKIKVQTGVWAVNDTFVIAETYDDTIFYVSDGSITFNVTAAHNSTHAFP
jgi:hypothetical protein